MSGTEGKGVDMGGGDVKAAAFGLLESDIADASFRLKDTIDGAVAAAFVAAQAAFYESEADRVTAIKPVLEAVFECALTEEEPVVPLLRRRGRPPAIDLFDPSSWLIIEVKQEPGSTASNPVAQSNYYAQRRIALLERKAGRDEGRQTYPTLQVVIEGCHIQLVASCMLDQFTSWNITDRIFVGHDRRSCVVDKVSHVLASARACVRALRAQRGIPISRRSRVAACFPQLLVVHGRRIQYLSQLKRNVFRVLVDGRHLCVLKLSHSTYGRAAHEAAFRVGIAPRLLEVESFGASGEAVLMEHAPPGYVRWYDREWGVDDAREGAGKAAIRAAALELHAMGFVHGDMRGVNVLVRAAEGGGRVDVLVVDFDWAGRDNVATYPRPPNRGGDTPIPWHEDAKQYGKIVAAHDLHLIDEGIGAGRHRDGAAAGPVGGAGLA